MFAMLLQELGLSFQNVVRMMFYSLLVPAHTHLKNPYEKPLSQRSSTRDLTLTGTVVED